MKIHAAAALALLSTALPSVASAQIWVLTNTTGLNDPNNDEFGGVVYDDLLYVGARNPTTGVQIWSHDGVNPWVPVRTDGFGDTNNETVVDAVVFGSEVFLLIGNAVTGAEVWSFDGTTWSQTNSDGFGDPQNATGEFFSLDGTLYAATINEIGGCGVYRFDGMSGWTTLGTGGLGDTNNTEADLRVFSNTLYAGTANDTDGCQVLRYDMGTSWTRVDPGSGFDASGSDNIDAGLYVFANKLFAGTENWATGIEVWEYLGGTSWVQRGTDGLGDPANVDFEGVAELGGLIYFGTVSFAGSEVWTFDGGTTFTQVSTEGFGDSNNIVTLFLQEFAGALYASTFNQTTGAEIWRRDAPMAWLRVDPGAPGPGNGGFGDSMQHYAQLTVLRGELYATLSQAVWQRRPDSIGAPLCAPGVPNSTGIAGRLTAVGRGVALANDVELTAHALPQDSFGVFLTSRTAATPSMPANSVGNLCLGSPAGKYVGPGQVQNTGSTGTLMLSPDLTQTPDGGGFVAVVPGETWHFQVWHRDRVGGSATSNFTEGLSILFH